MAHYRTMGHVLHERHTQHRDPDGRLYRDCERDLVGPAAPEVRDGTDVEVYVKHRRGPQR